MGKIKIAVKKQANNFFEFILLGNLVIRLTYIINLYYSSQENRYKSKLLLQQGSSTFRQILITYHLFIAPV